VIVRTDHPIAKILRKPDLAGQMIAWSVELSEFGSTNLEGRSKDSI